MKGEGSGGFRLVDWGTGEKFVEPPAFALLFDYCD